MMRNPNLDVWDNIVFFWHSVRFPYRLCLARRTCYLPRRHPDPQATSYLLPLHFVTVQREKPIMSSTFLRWGKKKDKRTVVQRQLPIQEECEAETSAMGAADPVSTLVL
jgi:hypothetical protein